MWIYNVMITICAVWGEIYGDNVYAIVFRCEFKQRSSYSYTLGLWPCSLSLAAAPPLTI